jgi:hypothetical protein
MNDDGTTAQTPAETMSLMMDQTLERALRDQMLRQERLRHAQVFLGSPLFFDLSAAPTGVSDDPAALQEHHRDLVYRIGVLESVLALMTEERTILERVMAAPDAGSDCGGEGAGEEKQVAPDQAPDQVPDQA